MPGLPWLMLACLWVLGACTPAPTASPELTDVADGPGDSGVGEPHTSDPVEPGEAGDSGDSGPVVEPYEAPEDDPPPDDSPPDNPPENDPADEGSGSGELPAARYTKIDASCGNDPGVGEQAKNFKLKTPEGKDISLAQYRGRVVVLNFWGTWCKPCLQELPEFSRLYRRYRKYGLTLVAVATDDDADAVAAMVKSKKISAKVAIGGEDLAAKYGSRAFPFTFIVDPQGKIVAAYDGYKEKCMGQLEQDLREQLEKRNAK